MKTLSVVPAYGRDYKSKQEVLQDWKAGKDFYAMGPYGSGYVSKNDNLTGFSAIQFHYRKRSRTFCVSM